jgi:hypothetical protein
VDYPIMLLATDVTLGRVLDREPNSWELGFLPRYLRADIAKRLGAQPELVYERTGRALDRDPGQGGRIWFLVIAIAFSIPAALAFRLRKWKRLALAVSLIPPVLVSVIVWGLAIVSSMPELRYNEALVAFLPTDAALPFLAADQRRMYARARLAMLLLVAILLAARVFAQPLWPAMPLAVLPLALAAYESRLGRVNGAP